MRAPAGPTGTVVRDLLTTTAERAIRLFNQVLVSFGAPEITNRVIAEIQQEGTCWCGGTVWQGKTAMRISVASWATTEADVDRSVDAMLRIAGKP